MANFETLLAEAAQVAPVVEARIQLFDAIWDTLPADSLPPLSGEWAEEIQKRSHEFDSGSAETVPWEQVKAEAMRRAGIRE